MQRKSSDSTIIVAPDDLSESGRPPLRNWSGREGSQGQGRSRPVKLPKLDPSAAESPPKKAIGRLLYDGKLVLDYRQESVQNLSQPAAGCLQQS